LFLLQTAKPVNTPGRAKAGRTQSETSFVRRPPIGAGSLFFTDDEAGEMFSNSYLSDLKAGRCESSSELNRGRLSSASSTDSGRIKELARRNSMVPLHLKSSYPVQSLS
jgi:hypothetical protein